MKVVRFFLILLLIPFIGEAQILDSFDSYKFKRFENQTLKVYSDSGLIQLQVIKPSLIKVSFSKRSEAESQNNLSPLDSTYVRITQNLESIFMQTDSLLIVISKLDFSIKFQSLREELYTINQSISFGNKGLNLQFVIANDEQFYNRKDKWIKPKIYAIKKLKSIISSNQYSIYFDDKTNGSLDFSNSSIWKMKIFGLGEFGYYINTGI